ncbi:MAG: hypothetical protein ACI361_08845 [Atopobiaceae bacterium]
MDCLPAAFFSVGADVLAARFESTLFRVGVVLVILAGALRACRKPSLPLLAAGVAGMLLMAWFARHLDGRDTRANWREQTVNAISQLCIMLAIVL